MECRQSKGPERKVINGRITIRSKERKNQERFNRLKKVSKQLYTNVSKELLELYESTFGVPEKFKSPASLGVADTTIERSKSSIPSTLQTRAEKKINDLKDPTYNYYTPLASPTPSHISVRSSSASSYVSAHNHFPSPRLSSASSFESIKEPLPPSPLVETYIQQPCYTYYNTKTFEHINSFELLDPRIYNVSNSWIYNKSIVNCEIGKESETVFMPEERSYWLYYNERTGDQRRSFKRLEKTDEEVELRYKCLY